MLDFVRQRRTDYTAAFWIEAGSKASLERNVVHLYQTLFGVRTAPGQEIISVGIAIMGVKSWFSVSEETVANGV